MIKSDDTNVKNIHTKNIGVNSMKIVALLSIPFVSYMVLVFVVAVMESFGGRGTVGESAMNEWFIIMQIMFFGLIITSIRKRMK